MNNLIIYLFIILFFSCYNIAKCDDTIIFDASLEPQTIYKKDSTLDHITVSGFTLNAYNLVALVTGPKVDFDVSYKYKTYGMVKY